MALNCMSEDIDNVGIDGSDTVLDIKMKIPQKLRILYGRQNLIFRVPSHLGKGTGFDNNDTLDNKEFKRC